MVSELTIKLFAHYPCCFKGGFFGIEVTYKNTPVLIPNDAAPLLTPLMPLDALIAARVEPTYGLVVAILNLRRLTKIIPLQVVRVAINVIDDFFRKRTCHVEPYKIVRLISNPVNHGTPIAANTFPFHLITNLDAWPGRYKSDHSTSFRIVMNQSL